MSEPFRIDLDRSAATTLSGQIHAAIRDAIQAGRLVAGARLPSWSDLGVARGTVRSAYDRLVDEQLVTSEGAAGTRVVGHPISDQRAARPGARPAS